MVAIPSKASCHLVGVSNAKAAQIPIEAALPSSLNPTTPCSHMRGKAMLRKETSVAAALICKRLSNAAMP